MKELLKEYWGFYFIVSVTFIGILFFSVPVFASQDYIASGFGDDTYNGPYCISGINNGLNAYENSNGKFVYWQLSNNWLMSPVSGGDEGHMYYGGGNALSNPSSVTWGVSSGTGPAGSFASYNCNPSPIDVTPSENTEQGITEVVVTCSSESNYWSLFQENGEAIGGNTCASGTQIFDTDVDVEGVYTFAEYLEDTSTCENITQCNENYTFQGSATFTLNVTQETTSLGALSDLTMTGQLAFASAFGFEYSEIVDWSSTQLKLLIGSGVGVMAGLMPWILAIVIIGTIVFFIYKGFRFFVY